MTPFRPIKLQNVTQTYHLKLSRHVYLMYVIREDHYFLLLFFLRAIYAFVIPHPLNHALLPAKFVPRGSKEKPW